MNEITKIHLGRQAFTVAVDAHKALRRYLEAIEQQVGTDGREVVEEVELRMAELLAERGIAGGKVVLLQDVEFLKQQLGSPHDFKDDEPEKAPYEKDSARNGDDDGKPAKRLYRDTDHGMLAGVAAGIAAFFSINVLIVRLIFLLTVIGGGWGILLYIVLWLVVPEAKTSSQRLRMHGRAVNVGTIQEIVDRADVPGAAYRAGRVLGRTVQIAGRIVLGVAGVGFVAAAVAALAALVSAGAYMLLHPEGAFVEGIFPMNGGEILLVMLGLVAAAVACMFMLLIGLAMVRRSWWLPGWGVAALVGVFLMAVALGAALLPDTIHDVRERYDAAHHDVTRTVEPFSVLHVKGTMNVTVQYEPAAEPRVVLRYFGAANPDTITTAVSDGTLAIDTRAFTERPQCTGLCLYHDPRLSITVYSPQLSAVRAEGGIMVNIAPSAEQSAIILTADVASSVFANSMQPASAVVVNRQSDTMLEMRLEGIRVNTQTDGAGLGLGQAAPNLDAAGKLTVESDRTCQLSYGFLYLRQPPARLTLNGEHYEPATAFRARQHPAETNTYNCVTVDTWAASESGLPQR